MRKYSILTLDKKEVAALSGELIHNEYICETAGFEPLEVKFKRFENAGLLQMIQSKALTSKDFREMYLNEDYSISIDDSPEDILEKMHKLNAHIAEVKAKAEKRNEKVSSFEETANSPSDSAAAETEEEAEFESQPEKEE